MLVPLPSVLSCHSFVFLRGSEAYKAHFWQIVSTEFLEHGLTSLVEALRKALFMCKTTDLHIVSEGLCVLIRRLDRLALLDY